MAIQFAGVLARFAGSLSSGMGRMTTMAGGAMARGSASNPGTFSSATSSITPEPMGAKIISRQLDKFIGSQKAMNKLNNKSNDENMKYMNRFEMSMRRTEKLMSRMNQYSNGMKGSFNVISNALAGIGIYQMFANKSGSKVQEQITAQATNSTNYARKVLQQVGNITKVDLLNFDSVFGALSKAAIGTPGSDADKLFSRLGISGSVVKNLQGIDRINYITNAISKNMSNAETMKMLSQTTGIPENMLKTMVEKRAEFNEQYDIVSQQLYEQAEDRLAELEKNRIKRATELDNAMENLKASFSGVTDWWEELWHDIKVGFIKTVTRVWNGIMKMWNNIADWWNESSWTPGKLGKFRLLDEPKEKTKAEIRREKEEAAKKELLFQRNRNIDRRQREIEKLRPFIEAKGESVPYIKGDLNRLNALTNYYESKTTDSTIAANNITAMLDKHFLSDDFQNAVKYGALDGQSYETTLKETIKDFVSNMIVNSLGWGMDPMDKRKALNAISDLNSGTPYNEVILKIYNNGYDVNSQPATVQSEYR